MGGWGRLCVCLCDPLAKQLAWHPSVGWSLRAHVLRARGEASEAVTLLQKLTLLLLLRSSLQAAGSELPSGRSADRGGGLVRVWCSGPLHSVCQLGVLGLLGNIHQSPGLTGSGFLGPGA